MATNGSGGDLVIETLGLTNAAACREPEVALAAGAWRTAARDV